MNETLSLIVNDSGSFQPSIEFDGDEMQSYQKQLMDDVNVCLSVSPGDALEEDLKYIRSNRKYCLYRSKRTVNELSKIVFDNGNPINYNERYYCMTKMLEGPEAFRQ